MNDGLLTRIVWNGCDDYVEAEDAMCRGYNFDGETLYHGSQKFTAFNATEINLDDLQTDEDGGPIMDGVFCSESGRCYK